MAETAGSLSLYKWLTFVSMYVGYTLIVFNRKSFTFAMPAIIASVGLDKDDAGLVSSSQNLAYTVSKFCGGVLSDAVNAKLLFVISLFFCGLCTVSMTAFQTSTAFAVIWFLQGLVQGGSWPACAKIMKQWFSPSEFGTWYGVINTTMNLACSVGPVLTAYLTVATSWRAGMAASGVASVITSLLCYVTIWNSPADVTGSSVVDDGAKKDDKDQSRGRGRGTWQDMLRSPFMWLISLSYFLVFLGRTATLDWAQLYLIQDLGHSQYVGSMFLSSLEVGGIVGSIIAGYVADRLVMHSRSDDVRGSPRLTMTAMFVALNIVGLHALCFVISSQTSQMLITLIGFTIGFGIYGPVSLYGVMAIEAAPTHLSGTSHAIVSLACNIGAILAGLPFSYIAKHIEWKGAFILLEVLLVGVLIAKIVMRKVEYKMVPTKKKLQ